MNRPSQFESPTGHTSQRPLSLPSHAPLHQSPHRQQQQQQQQQQQRHPQHHPQHHHQQHQQQQQPQQQQQQFSISAPYPHRSEQDRTTTFGLRSPQMYNEYTAPPTPRASHLHLPAVSTYIEHYHYYNFNGNCTVQQASNDGQANTIRMVSSNNPPSQSPHHSHPSASRVEVAPVPPPIPHPLSSRHHSDRPLPSYHHRSHHTPPDPPSYHHRQTDRPDRPPQPSSPYSSLPTPHLPPLSATNPPSAQPTHSSSLLRQPYLSVPPRLSKLPTSSSVDLQQRRQQQQQPLLARLRSGNMTGDTPILAPLQSNMPATLSPLHAQDDAYASERPAKRSRLGQPIPLSMPSHNEISAHRPNVSAPGNAAGVTTSMPPLMANVGGAAGDNNTANRGTSVSEECALPTSTVRTLPSSVARASHAAVGYSMDRMISNANSSSPSQGEYAVGQRKPNSVGNDLFEQRTGSVGGARATRTVEETQSNDWEAVVEMYTTGKGTEDGIALKNITKGDGRRVSDRKLLEKRRTIGKTYECLGVERFEAAIGYKIENGIRRKQKMYHVISRCRVVNAMRKSGEKIPLDYDELTKLIDQRIAAKEAIKEAGKTGNSSRRPHMAEAGGSVVPFATESSHRLRSLPSTSNAREGNRIEEEDSRVDGTLPREGEDRNQRIVRPLLGLTSTMSARNGETGAAAGSNLRVAVAGSQRDDDARANHATGLARF